MPDLAHASSDTGPLIGERVRQARTDRNDSQQALATRAGISIRTLTRIEQGEDVRHSTLSALAAALGLTVAELLTYERAGVTS